MKIFFDVKVGDKVLYMGQDNIINEIEVTKNDYYNDLTPAITNMRVIINRKN